MPYVLLIFGKITTNKHTVQYAKTRIFISKFRSFFCNNLRVFLRVFRKITAVGNRSAAAIWLWLSRYGVRHSYVLYAFRLWLTGDSLLAMCKAETDGFRFYRCPQHLKPNTQNPTSVRDLWWALLRHARRGCLRSRRVMIVCFLPLLS